MGGARTGRGPFVAPFPADLDAFATISEPAGSPDASLEAMAAGLPVAADDRRVCLEPG